MKASAAALIVTCCLASGGARAQAQEGEGARTAPAASEVSAGANLAMYVYQGSALEVMAGPKVTVGYSRYLGGHLWLDATLGVMVGFCSERPDEKDCVTTPGYAVEPLVGLKIQSGPNARSRLYAKVLAGGLLASPDRWSGGEAALVRAGGGVRHFFTPGIAVALELTGALGVGRFEIGYQSVERAVLAFDVGLGLEWRF